MNFIWKPTRAVLPFFFGEAIEPHLSMYAHEFADDMYEEISYEFFDNSISVYVNKKERTIQSIRCDRNCYWSGRNLINLPIDKFFRHADLENEIYKVEKISLTDEEEQDVYDFDLLGLQLWVDAGKRIVCVFVH
jgi:hypothetical protein